MTNSRHDDIPIARSTASVERVRVSLNCIYATPRKAQHKMAEFRKMEDISGVISSSLTFADKYIYIFFSNFFEVNLDGFCE